MSVPSMPAPLPPLHVLGAGSIGLLWASRLRLAFPSYPVKLLVRRRSRRLSEKGMTERRRRADGGTSGRDKVSPEQQQITVAYQRSLVEEELELTGTATTGGQRLSRPVLVRVPAEVMEEEGEDEDMYEAAEQDGNDGATRHGKTTVTMTTKKRKGRTIGNLLVATKAGDAYKAVRSLRHRISEDTRVILLCNGSLSVLERFRNERADGWGSDGKAAAAGLCPTRIVLAWTSHGAYQPQPPKTTLAQAPAAAAASFPALENDKDGDDAMDEVDGGIERFRSVVHAVGTGTSRTVLEDFEEMAAVWDAAGFNCTSVTSATMQRQLWLKLAANCSINPLTALRMCRNGELLLLDPPARSQIEAVVDEVVRVANASASSSSSISSSSSTAKPEEEDQLLTVEEALEFVLQVIHDTSLNYSSMAQDIRSGRTTEIDDLNGFVVRRGRELGIPCEENDRLCRLISQLSN